MATLPLVTNVEGDFVLQLVAVDTDDTMDVVAEKVAMHSVGRRVRPQPGRPCACACKGLASRSPRRSRSPRPASHRWTQWRCCSNDGPARLGTGREPRGPLGGGGDGGRSQRPPHPARSPRRQRGARVPGICPHQELKLVEGDFDGRTLVCRGHLWEFDLRTGEGVNPAECSLACYPVKVEDDKVSVCTEGVDPRFSY